MSQGMKDARLVSVSCSSVILVTGWYQHVGRDRYHLTLGLGFLRLEPAFLKLLEFCDCKLI